MNTFVALQIALTGETFRTIFAYERTFAAVASQMDLQTSGVRKTFTANATQVILAFFCMYLFHVQFEIIIQRKSLGTQRALVTTIAVSFLVRIQRRW